MRVQWVARWAVAFFLGSGFICGTTLQTDAQSPEAERTVEAIASACTTPQAVAQFLRKELRFKPDDLLFGRPDYWQTPQELLSRGAGDCEDFALLAQALLARQGRESFLLSLYGAGGYAHTVCVFLEEGRYSVINEDRLIRYRAASLEELATFLYPTWRWGAVALQEGSKGRPLRLLRNLAF